MHYASNAPVFEVVCGNIGTVYSGTDEVEARAKYQTYIEASKAECGRAGGEDVALMRDGDIAEEYNAPAFRCDSCAALMINGVFCHETGCPNAGARWDSEREAWIRYYRCFMCGCDVERGESCDCQDGE